MIEIDSSRPYVRAFAPGRTELAGNHTDHQGGRVIAATVDRGIEIAAQPSGTNAVHVASVGFDPFELDVDDVAARADEKGTTVALVRGVIAGLRDAGIAVPGFVAHASSTIPAGGGLSSSAAFELALASALTCLADERVCPDSVQLARIAQAAERSWFGKPCGLMDQLSIALGGVNEMDFGEGGATYERIAFDFEQAGYAIFLIDTHCDHSLYTREYAQVACDMDDVAHLLGYERLSQLPGEVFLAHMDDVRRDLGDLPVLRGVHYFHEMALVDARAEALRAGDIESFLAATRRSGASSAQFLQNVSTFDRRSQPAMVALALADWLAGDGGAARIHGGGFGGTVQAFVPLDAADTFACAVDACLGDGSCVRYRISEKGAHAEWTG